MENFPASDTQTDIVLHTRTSRGVCSAYKSKERHESKFFSSYERVFVSLSIVVVVAVVAVAMEFSIYCVNAKQPNMTVHGE